MLPTARLHGNHNMCADSKSNAAVYGVSVLSSTKADVALKMIQASRADLAASQEGSVRSKQSSDGRAKGSPTTEGESPIAASYQQGGLFILMVRISCCCAAKYFAN